MQKITVKNFSIKIMRKIKGFVMNVEENTMKNIENKEENMKEIIITNAKYSRVYVMIDNGHGNNTKGKGSPYGLNKVPPELYIKEWSYTREIAHKLKEALEADGFTNVYLITPEDEDVRLSERVKRINKLVAEAKTKGCKALSISIHLNAAGMGNKWTNATGWSAWTTKGVTISDRLATCLYDAAIDICKKHNQKVRFDHSDGDPDFEENFTMCKGPACAAVLTENFFQDGISDARFLLSEEGKQAIVEIHRRGIESYVNEIE